MPEPRTIFITGSTSGLGLAAARHLLSGGHRVIVHGRDASKTAAVARTLAAEAGTEPAWLTGELGSLASVRQLASELLERFPTLDVLVNNGAISNWGRAARTTTVDGHELIFATNFLSHYALTRAVLPRLLESGAPRVINVGARQMGARLDFDDLEHVRAYDPMQAVLRAKLGMFALTRALARRHAADGLTAACLDPGLANTGYQSNANAIMRIALALLGRPPERVAELYGWLVESNEVSNEGLLYAKPGRPTRWQSWVADDANVERAWQQSARLVGLDP